MQERGLDFGRAVAARAGTCPWCHRGRTGRQGALRRRVIPAPRRFRSMANMSSQKYLANLGEKKPLTY